MIARWKQSLSFKLTAFFVLVAMTGLSTGCLTSMTGIAPSTTPITANDSYTELGETWGTAYGMAIYGIPIFPESLSKLSTERAIRRGGGDAMIEVSQDYTMIFMYLIILYIAKTKGTAVNVERGGRIAAN